MATLPRDAGPILITGCSSGIGLATALHLARVGYRVIAGIKSDLEAGTLLEEVKRTQLGIETLPIDITQEESTQKAFDHIKKSYGRLTALVNNAGIGIGGFFEDMGEDEFRAQFETNLFGTARVTRHAIPFLRASAPSALITITSLAGRIGVAGMSAYHASKFALEGLFECLHYELKPHGVRVSVLEPGLIRTPLIDNWQLSRGYTNAQSVHHPRVTKLWKDFKARFERTAQSPQIVADAIARILSDPAPQLRYPIGSDAKVILAFQKVLPQRVMNWLWTRLSG
jgi:NAD(P)-dependent dehydrogenase (short-subunit alcohol dehydrogenase family)